MTDARIKFKASMNIMYLNTFTIINEKLVNRLLFSLIFQGIYDIVKVMQYIDKKVKSAKIFRRRKILRINMLK